MMQPGMVAGKKNQATGIQAGMVAAQGGTQHQKYLANKKKKELLNSTIKELLPPKNANSKAAVEYVNKYVAGQTLQKIKNDEYVTPAQIDSAVEYFKGQKNTGWAAMNNPSFANINGDKISTQLSVKKDYYSFFKNEDDYKKNKTNVDNQIKYYNYNFKELRDARLKLEEERDNTKDQKKKKSLQKEIDWLETYSSTKEYSSVDEYKEAIDLLREEILWYENEAIRKEKNKEEYDEEAYNEKIKSLKTQIKNLKKSPKTHEESRILEQKNNRSLDNYDGEIYSLEERLKQIEKAQEDLYEAVSGYGISGSKNRKALEQYNNRKNEILKKAGGYKSVDELKEAIYTLKADRKSAKRHQKLKKYSEVSDVNSENYDADFFEKNAEKLDEAVARVRDKSGFMEIDEDNAFTAFFKVGWMDDGSFFEMTDDEIKLYIYYSHQDKKNGTDKAEKYRDLLQQDLNNRRGQKASNALEGHLGGQLTFAVTAGFDQFEEGITNFFNFSDDYIPTSSIQVASGLVREDLADAGPKIFASSLGQIGYDTINTTANMLPSVALSMANPVLGTATMGLSAAGNAYQEGLNSGMDKGQARTYSTLVGVSEAALSATLSKVFGGKVVSGKVKNAIAGIKNGCAKFAANYGTAFATEGAEEGLQEILNPLFENIALGYNKNGFEDIDWSAVAYSALLGGLSGGNFEVVGSVFNHKNANSIGKSIIANGMENQVIDMALKSDVNSNAYKLANRIQNSGVMRPAQLGSLATQTMTELIGSKKNIVFDAVYNRATELGLNESSSKSLATQLSKLAGGETVSYTVRKSLAKEPEAHQIISEMQNGESNAWVSEMDMAFGEVDNMMKQLTSAIKSPEKSTLQSRAEGDIINQETDGGDNDVKVNAQEWGQGGNFKESTESLQGNLGGNNDQSGTTWRKQRSDPRIRDRKNRRNLTQGEKETLKTTAIKNEDGSPKEVCHFTDNMDFDTFAKGDIGFHFGNEQQAVERGKILNKQGRIIRAYLDIKNPIRISTDIMSWRPRNIALKLVSDDVISVEQHERILKLDNGAVTYDSPAAVELRRILSEKGYDGIVYPNMFEADGDSYIAFYPEQVIIIDDGKNTQATSENEAASFLPESDSENGNLQSGAKKELTEEEKSGARNRILSAAKKLDKNVKVVYVPRNSQELNGKKGKYVRDTKTMYLSEDLSTKEAYIEVFKHEFIHRLELRKDYAAFKNFLFKKSKAFGYYAQSRLRLLDEQNGREATERTREQAIEELTQMYLDNFKNDSTIDQSIRDNFTREKAEREAVADFVARVLFKGNTTELRVSLRDNDIKRVAEAETDIDMFEELYQTNRPLYRRVIDAIRDFIRDIVGIHGVSQLKNEIDYLEKRLARVYDSADTKKAATDSGEVYKDESFYVDEIIGADGTNYGIGVYLNSDKLDNLSDSQRIEKVREHIKNLGGHSFTAFDSSGNKVEIKVAPKTKYRTEKGNSEKANRHLTNFLKNPQKQETLLFIDEVISAASFKEQEPATKSHGWLDNNGKNDWDVWTTYIQDKENTIWEAKLKITNTTNGEKILYDVHPIEKVGQGRTLPKSSTNDNISENSQNVKQKQLEIISKTNPAPNTYQTWVRSVDDIKTLAETLEDSDWQDESINPDLTRTDIQNAIESGTIIVYSSHPIEQGVFVSPSRMEAESYSGDGKVYEEVVNISDVAWIDPTQGQYAKIEENNSEQSFSSNSSDESWFGDELERNKNNFQEDKYYARQIDKWEELRDTAYITVGMLKKDSPLNLVGLPEGKMYFDVSKIKKEMTKHGDHLDTAILKNIPKLLSNPIAITEYKEDNTVNVYGQLYYHNTPVVVGVVATNGRGGNVITKIRTVHARGNFVSQITDDTVLYLNENKKETDKWFQAQGQHVPMRGTKYGFIRSITLKNKNVNSSFSSDDLDTVPQKVESENVDTASAEDTTEEKPREIVQEDINAQHEALLKKYENGEITRDEYLAEMDGLYGKAVEQYGEFEKGEYDETKIPVPKAIAKDKPIERFARTFVGAAKLTPEMIEQFEADVLLGEFSYSVASDEKALRYADRTINNGNAEAAWEDVVNGKHLPSKNDIAIGEKLLANAVETNDIYNIMKISSELADIFTRAGQVVQAARLFGKMTGAGRLVSVQRMVDTLNKDRMAKYGYDTPPIKINPDKAEALTRAKTKQGQDEAVSDIMTDIAAQTESTLLDKWNAWRYFAMLCNPKTHIRNLLGNGIFVPTVRVKDLLAAGMEKTFIKEENRTKTLTLKLKKEYIDFAKADGKNKEVKVLLKGGKYSDKNALQEYQKVFKNAAMEFITSFNSNALEAEDSWFKNKHYIHALAGFLQARKINLKNISDEQLFAARTYAVKEARKATFNDESVVANWIQNSTRVRRDANGKIIKYTLAINIAAEGVLPFKRTPINIIKRGVEYSPMGLAKTLSKGVYDVKKGKITPTEFIDGLASGITGTGIMALGMLAANLGWVSGGEDDDEKSVFEKWLGKQEYSIEFAGKSYTIDWGAPACIPFFIGVEVINTMNETEDFQFSNISNIAWNMLEPITNLSMLSGMQGVIESTRYAEPNQTLATMTGNVISSYAMQAVPSLFGALARTIDPKERKWYTDKNSKWFDDFAQSIGNNIRSKIPGLSYTQPPKIDPWGREVSRGNVGERVLENFISPGYYSKLDYDETSEELKRLFVKTGGNVFPKVAPKSFEVDGETKQLTADEYVTYAKAKGSYSFDYIQEFLNNKAYKGLTDDERADVIENIYKFANAKAKATVSDYDPAEINLYKTVTKWERNGRSAVDYYIHNAISK